MKHKEKKHILINANQAWNIYNFRKGLITHLLNKNNSITITAPHDDFSEKLIKIGCKVIDVKLSGKGKNPLQDIFYFIKIYFLILKINPDIVFNYTIKPNIYATLAAKIARKPCISITTGLGSTFISNNWLSKITKILYKISFTFANEVWFLNEDDEQAFTSKKIVKTKKTLIIPGEGIDTTFFCPQKNTTVNNKFTFLFIGRILKDKGIIEYLEAANSITNNRQDVLFQILGPAGVENPSALSRDDIYKWESNNNIQYLGETNDVREFIAKADCIVLPSYREGVPRTLMEASSMEKPIIATDVPGCRDVIIQNITGLLCHKQNVQSLEDCMQRLINMSVHDLEIMGKNGRLHISKNYSERIIFEIYDEALKRYNII